MIIWMSDVDLMIMIRGGDLEISVAAELDFGDIKTVRVRETKR